MSLFLFMNRLFLTFTTHLINVLNVLPNSITLTLSVGGPRECVRFASRSGAGAPAEGATMASRKPLLVCECSGCGEPAPRHRLAALSQCPPACTVQGMSALLLGFTT